MWDVITSAECDNMADRKNYNFIYKQNKYAIRAHSQVHECLCLCVVLYAAKCRSRFEQRLPKEYTVRSCHPKTATGED